MKESLMKIEDLQMAWDMGIVRRYFEEPWVYTHTIVRKFLAENDLTYEQFFNLELKRTPGRTKYHWKCTVVRFVVGYLPGLHKACEKYGKKRITDIVIALSKSNCDTYRNQCDNDEGMKELHKEVYATKKRDRRNYLNSQMSLDYIKSFNRGNQWGTVK